MKHLIKTHKFRYLIVFLLGIGTAVMVTQAFTIETSIQNTVQVIKSIFISNDGSTDLSGAVVSINYNGNALRVHTGSIDVDTICDNDGNNCKTVSNLNTSADNDIYSGLTNDYLPYYTNSGFKNSSIHESSLGGIGIGKQAIFGQALNVSGSTTFENGNVTISDSLSVNNDLSIGKDLSVNGSIQTSDEIVSDSFLQFIGTNDSPCTGSDHRGKVEYKQSCDDTDGVGFSGTMQNAFVVCAQTGENNFSRIAIWDSTREIDTDCPSGLSETHYDNPESAAGQSSN